MLSGVIRTGSCDRRGDDLTGVSTGSWDLLGDDLTGAELSFLRELLVGLVKSLKCFTFIFSRLHFGLLMMSHLFDSMSLTQSRQHITCNAIFKDRMVIQ